jgi:hypothetical protein
MKMLSLFLSALLATACIGAQGLHAEKTAKRLQELKYRPKGPTIKVLLLQDVEGALVEVKGSYNLYDPRTGKKLETAFLSSSYYLHPTKDGIKWGAEFPGIYQVLIVPDSPKTSVLVAGIEYTGMVYAYQIDGAIGFVNELSLDDYADSILSSQIKSQIMNPEALATLAIACRSDALYKSRHPTTKYWDVKASQVGYQGCALCVKEPALQKAMTSTSRMILSNGQAVSWFTGKTIVAPLEEIEKLASDKKDAKAILQHFFPGSSIEVCENKA